MAYITHSSGMVIPAPAYGSGGFTLSTLVDGGRNQNGRFIGQVIGDDKLKVDITFAALSPAELQRFLALFDRRQGGSFTNWFTVYDPALGAFRQALMYVGDRSGKPLKVNPSTSVPEWFLDIKANLIEV